VALRRLCLTIVIIIVGWIDDDLALAVLEYEVFLALLALINDV